jgi:chorismate mutase
MSVETTFRPFLLLVVRDTLRRVADEGSDPTIRQLRGEISQVDHGIVEAVNRRLELVAELKRYKADLGIEFVDPEQERRLLDRLVEANVGPLSSEAVRELFERILELTKREVGRIDADASPD